MLGARCRVDGPLSRTCRPCFNHCNLRTSSPPPPPAYPPPLLEVSTNKFKAHQERPQQTAGARAAARCSDTSRSGGGIDYQKKRVSWCWPV